MGLWSFEIVDLAGATEAFIAPYGTSHTRRRNDASQLTGNLLSVDAAIGDLFVAERAVKAYRRGTLRFHGQLSDPLTIAGVAGATFNASDPLYFLSFRRCQVEEDYGNTDLGQIAWATVAVQHARQSVHLRQGTLAASVKRDVILAEGSVCRDNLLQLAQRDQGIWFWVDPVDGVAGILGELRVAWPDAGAARPQARFEFGDGTLDNLADYRISFGLPKNGVTVTGATVGSTVTPVARREDATSIARYGLLEDEAAFTDVDDTVSLDQHALNELKPNPPVTLTLTPRSSDDEALGETTIPRLYDDFDAGDAVPILIRDQHFEWQGTARVGEATVQISDDGEAETLTNLTLEAL